MNGGHAVTKPEHPDRSQPEPTGEDTAPATTLSDPESAGPESGGTGSGNEWITLDIDVYVLDWFRRNTDDPQAAINAVLHQRMEREQKLERDAD